MNKLPATMSEDDPQTEDEDDGNESQTKNPRMKTTEANRKPKEAHLETENPKARTTPYQG